jgi:hypothetical protein
MKKSNPALLSFFLLFVSPALVAQNEDLTQDRAFFEQQAKLYQRWLDHNGLGKTLHVKTVEVEPQQVALYLAFPTENADSVAAAWDQLKKDYAALNTGLSLEQELFYKMLHMMELRQSSANVQLYDTYDTRREPCFYRGIFVKEGAFQLDSSGCRAQRLDIHISAGDLKSAKKHSIASFQKQFTQQYVFDKIHQYAKQRYERKTCENRYPAVGPPLIDGNLMRFEVTDLCREVLKDEQNSTVCAFLNAYLKPCNWIKREKLTFSFSYQQTDNGFTLKCEVEGKVGSGFYDQVGRGGYLDMEIDFDGYLKDYADKLQYELKQAIIQ